MNIVRLSFSNQNDSLENLWKFVIRNLEIVVGPGEQLSNYKDWKFNLLFVPACFVHLGGLHTKQEKSDFLPICKVSFSNLLQVNQKYLRNCIIGGK